MRSIKELQEFIGTVPDGVWGPNSQAFLDAIILQPRSSVVEHSGKASSFADPADVTAFKHCKALGKSDDECFRFGDNAIGVYGESTAEGSGPSCALPPEDIQDRWGNVAAGKGKSVVVAINGHEVICVLKDRMPHRANITNGAIIDLNPDAVKAAGLKPPIMQACSWRWQ